MIEQPTSSWLFKQVCFKDATNVLGLKCYLTHQGLFGHDLMKSTHLMSNMDSLVGIVRRATKAAKQKHAERVARKVAAAKAKGQRVKIYYVKNSKGFHGAADLASSAVYPFRFVQEIYKCWLNSFQHAA